MVVSIDAETTKFPYALPWQKGARLCLISIVSDSVRKSFVLDHPEATKSIDESVAEIKYILKYTSKLMGHNIKFDIHWLRFLLGYDYINGFPIYCTQVAEYTLNNQPRIDTLSLNDLAVSYGLPKKLDKVKIMWDAGYDTPEIPATTLSTYCEQDCAIALEIYKKQIPKILERKQQALISMEMEALKRVAKMEENGMLLDVPRLQSDLVELEKTQKVVVDRIKCILGDININSSDQLSCALYGGTYKIDSTEVVKKTLKSGEEKEYERKCQKEIYTEGLGIKPPEKSELAKKGMYSTSAPMLQILKGLNHKQQYVVNLLLEYAKLETLRTTFLESLLEKVGADGIAHQNLNQTITATSRLSCTNPNLQNIPRDGSSPIKHNFITRFPC